MLPVDGIEVFMEDGLVELKSDKVSNADGYLTTYYLPLTFSYKEEKRIGDMIVYFEIIGFGLDGYEGGVDTFYHVPAFLSSVDGEEYLGDAQAFQFIFNNFGEEIQEIIEGAIDHLYEYYTDGIKKHDSLQGYISDKVRNLSNNKK